MKEFNAYKKIPKVEEQLEISFYEDELANDPEGMNVNGYQERKAKFFVCKVFEGSDFQEFRKSVIDEFGSVRTLSPEASRKQSSEVYLIAKRKRR